MLMATTAISEVNLLLWLWHVTDLFGFVYKYELVSGTKEPRTWATHVTAYPNPTSERATIGFELETAAKVRLNVYDQQGRLVHAVAEQSMGAGKQSFTWDANAAQPGMYLYHLLVDGGVVTGLVSVVR